MKLHSRLAHELVEQFVEWHRLPSGEARLGFSSSAPYARLIRSGEDGDREPVSVAPWFTDDDAIVANKLLSNLKRDRPAEFEVLMYYYFVGQRQDLTAARFKKHTSVVNNLVNAGIAYVDGQLSAFAA